MSKKYFLVVSLCSVALLTGCSRTTITHSGVRFVNGNSNWLVLPFANLTETPDAGTRAKMITANLLQIKGLRTVITYQAPVDKKQLLQLAEKPLTTQQAIDYAMRHHVSYIVTGSVTEWRYKIGLDGEPAVGVTMQIVRVPTAQVIWSSVGSKIGSSRAGLSQTGQSLLSNMVKGMPKIA